MTIFNITRLIAIVPPSLRRGGFFKGFPKGKPLLLPLVEMKFVLSNIPYSSLDF